MNVDDLCIVVGKQTMPVVINRRKRARYLRLRLNYRNQVAVSVPWHCSHRKALRFVEKHREWLKQQLACIPRVHKVSQWLKKYPFVSAYGNRFAACIDSNSCKRAGYLVDRERQEILLRMPDSHSDFDVSLQRLIKSFAKEVISCRLKYHAQRLGLNFKKLSIRDQVSRWGSCSARGSISLNWRLVLIAPELQDYVMLHELAHLTEMNHSCRFWALLDQYDPNRLAHETGLNSITAEIMRVGR